MFQFDPIFLMMMATSMSFVVQSAEIDRTCSCGTKGNRGRIAGGQESSKGSHPWFASLWEKTDGAKKEPKCGATLINNLYLLTAAHCVANRTNNLVALFDIYDVNEIDSGKMYDISKVILPSEHKFLKNDIALLRLAKPLDLHDSIRPACLSEKDVSLMGKTLTAIGFGKLGLYQDWSRKLQEVGLPYYEDDCDDLYGSDFLADHICARDAQNVDEKDVCIGDSGGPLLLKDNHSWTIVGITSHGNCVGSPSAIFTRVSYHLKWILHNTRDASYCVAS